MDMKVEKFDGRNFKQWKFQVNCALRAKGLDINAPRPEDVERERQWNKDNGMAMFVLTSSMDFSQISLIENCETAKEIMIKLEALYEHKSEFNKMMIHEKFYQYSYNSHDTMGQHVSKVEGLAKQLRESGEKISDTAIITKILTTLPMSYRSLRQAWLSLDPQSQTIHNLTSRLIDEKASLANEPSNEMVLVASRRDSKPKQAEYRRNQKTGMSNTGSHRFVCYNCNKRGHFTRECKAPKKSGHRNHEQEGMSAFNAESNNISLDEDVWILDSGASMHMT